MRLVHIVAMKYSLIFYIIADYNYNSKCCFSMVLEFFFFFQAEDGIRDDLVTGVQTCALPIFDYTKEDFTKGDQRYDVILDNVANHSISEYRRVLTPKGKYIMIGGGSGAKDWQGLFGMMTRPFKAMLLKPFVSQEMGMMLTDPKQNDLVVLADLMQSGKVKPVIDRTYTLEQLPDAVRYVEEGHARGKVVITVE